MQLYEAAGTHANMREWYFGGQQRGLIGATCGGIFVKWRQPENFAPLSYSAQRSFMARNQALAAAIPAAHGGVMEISCDQCVRRFGGPVFVAILSATSTREALPWTLP
jgi:hypothetical protein